MRQRVVRGRNDNLRDKLRHAYPNFSENKIFCMWLAHSTLDQARDDSMSVSVGAVVREDARNFIRQKYDGVSRRTFEKFDEWDELHLVEIENRTKRFHAFIAECKSMGMTRAQIRERMGLTENRFCAMLNGRVAVSERVIAKIGEVER